MNGATVLFVPVKAEAEVGPGAAPRGAAVPLGEDVELPERWAIGPRPADFEAPSRLHARSFTDVLLELRSLSFAEAVQHIARERAGRLGDPDTKKVSAGARRPANAR